MLFWDNVGHTWSHVKGLIAFLLRIHRVRFGSQFSGINGMWSGSQERRYSVGRQVWCEILTFLFL